MELLTSEQTMEVIDAANDGVISDRAARSAAMLLQDSGNGKALAAFASGSAVDADDVLRACDDVVNVALGESVTSAGETIALADSIKEWITYHNDHPSVVIMTSYGHEFVSAGESDGIDTVDQCLRCGALYTLKLRLNDDYDQRYRSYGGQVPTECSSLSHDDIDDCVCNVCE